MVGHITPEAHVGDALAIVQDGDQITINAETKQLTLPIADEEITRRAGQACQAG